MEIHRRFLAVETSPDRSSTNLRLFSSALLQPATDSNNRFTLLSVAYTVVARTISHQRGQLRRAIEEHFSCSSSLEQLDGADGG